MGTTMQNEEKQNEEKEEEEKQMLFDIAMFIVSLIQMFIRAILWATMRSEMTNDDKTRTNNGNRSGNRLYFMESADNVQIIRYIIGDLESLFDIGKQQQN